MLEEIMNRIRLLVGRCVIYATKYDGDELTADAELLAGEKRRSVEFSQQYGFSSRPKGNVSGVCLFLGGNRDNGVIVSQHSDDFEEKLSEGEVMVHSPFGQKIYLKEDGSIEISAASGKNVVCKNNFECEMEVYANSKTARVSLSQHIHPTSVGPTSQPTPGI